MLPADKAHSLIRSFEESFRSVEQSAARSKEGVFYTPPQLAKYTVTEAIKLWRKSSSGHPSWILDPACGAGSFLIEAQREIKSAFPKEISKITLCGIDKDYSAKMKAEEVLASERGVFSFRIKHSNALLSAEDTNIPSSLSPISWKQIFPEAVDQGGFDIIIGNPPYGISRGEKFSPVEKELLEIKYDWIRSGKLNKYLAFIGLSYKLLKPGGIAALIVPNSWLGIKSGEKLRKFLLQSKSLRNITILPKDAFSDPSVETVILFIQKDNSQKLFTIRHLTDISSGRVSTETTLNIDECLNFPSAIIPTKLTTTARDALTIILNNSTPLGNKDSPFLPRIALQAYAEGKGIPSQSAADVKNRIFDLKEKSDSSAIPYLQGRDIGQFKVNWSGGYLKYGPWLAESQDLKYFSGPRILLREILGPPTNPLIAAYTKETYLYNKSVLHILPRSSSTTETEMLGLLGLLYSDVASLIINHLGRKSQRQLFPKIVLEDLYYFPIPKSFKETKNELALITKELISNVSKKSMDKLNEVTNRAYNLMMA